MTKQSTWGDEDIKRLATLWLAGKSGQEISGAFGGRFSRCAVLGKVHRLGLSRQEAAKPRVKSTMPPQRRSLAAPALAHLRAPRPSGAPKAPLTILPPPVIETPTATRTSITRGHCHWPIGEPRADNFGYCGAPAEGSFCPDHARLAYRPKSTLNDKFIARIARLC